MIVVDSAIWIDYFSDRPTPETNLLDELLGEQRIATGGLIVTEVLQGFRSDTQFERARQALAKLHWLDFADQETAIAAARSYGSLRSLGLTVRKTIDTLIATRCILDGHALLFSDRDFLPFVEHCGLRSAMAV